MRRCVHLCPCGAELCCTSDPDRCVIGPFWTCPNCEQQQFDDYIETVVLSDEEETRREPQQPR
jgi:hypothetical protein